MKLMPDSVWSNVLSLSSRNCCTCGDNSEPYVAVAIKQPPPSFGTIRILYLKTLFEEHRDSDGRYSQLPTHWIK